LETWLAVVGETSTIMRAATLQSNRRPGRSQNRPDPVYAVSLFSVTTPRYCLRQQGACRSFLCAVFSRDARKNRTHLNIKYHSAEGATRQLRKS